MMALWHFVGEPTLDELIEDEMMIPVMRSAGIDAVRLRAAYAEMARRRRGDAAPRPATALRSRSREAVLCL
jgi:hypothetical protein